MSWAVGIVVGAIVALITYLVLTSILTLDANEALLCGLIALLVWVGVAVVVHREGWGQRGL